MNINRDIIIGRSIGGGDGGRRVNDDNWGKSALCSLQISKSGKKASVWFRQHADIDSRQYNMN